MKLNRYTREGCGCSSTVVVTPKCDDCIAAAHIIIPCFKGPLPGELFEGNIFELAAMVQQDGTEVKLINFDGTGIKEAIVSPNGDFEIEMTEGYNKDAKYKLHYRILEVDGFKSNTGSISICKKSPCPNEECCNPVTGENVEMSDVYVTVPCRSEIAYDISDWNIDNLLLTSKIDGISLSIVAEELIVKIGALDPGKYELNITGFTDKCPCAKKLFIEVPDLCKDGEFGDAVCDPCTGDWIITQGTVVDGSTGIAPTTTTVSTGGPVVFHNIEVNEQNN